MGQLLVTHAEIAAARAALPVVVRRTPILPLAESSFDAGCDVRLKCENLQVTGSYKVRASFAAMNAMPVEARSRGAALSSSGNFAAAFAYAGRYMRVPATLVMMEKTSPFKVEKTRKYGGEVVFCENRYEARFETLEQLHQTRGLSVVNHLHDPSVIAGHGTIGLEIIEDWQDVQVILVPVSTGGLLAGVATAVKSLKPTVKVIGVQPDGSNAAALSFRQGEIVRIEQVSTICDALTATAPGPLPWEHVRTYVDGIVTVSDEAVVEAMVHLFEHAKLVVEPAGAVALAAVRAGKLKFPGQKVVAVASGGNVDPARFAEWLAAGRQQAQP